MTDESKAEIRQTVEQFISVLEAAEKHVAELREANTELAARVDELEQSTLKFESRVKAQKVQSESAEWQINNLSTLLEAITDVVGCPASTTIIPTVTRYKEFYDRYKDKVNLCTPAA